MFSFHKPRVYRSTEGCCICRAKSSSSRFTDSRKYEDDSVKCFNLGQPRQGEICNACVLLVKRFKRLPNGSNRHWGHVVDARVGPGMKSMSKFKKLREELALQQQQPQQQQQQPHQQQSSTVTEKVQKTSSSFPEKFSKIFRKNKKGNNIKINNKNRRTEDDIKFWDEPTLPLTPESFNSDTEEQMQTSKLRNGISRRKLLKPKKYQFPSNNIQTASFIDENFWNNVKICCGYAYENAQIGALIIDVKNFQPCSDHIYKNQLINPPIVTSTTNGSNNSQQKTDFKYMSNNYNGNINLNSYSDFPSNKLLAESTLPILKKHHLFFKRQQENFPVGNLLMSTKLSNVLDNKNTNNVTTAATVDPLDVNKNKTSIMHKIKSDTAGKIIKHSINKINTTMRLKHDLLINETKGLVDKINPISIKKLDGSNKIIIQNKKHIEPTGSGTKFNDNSSDSGFDENLLDRKSTSPIEENRGDNKFIARPIQTMFLANGIQVHGQRQNLILTGNEVAAKLLKSRRQQQPVTNRK